MSSHQTKPTFLSLTPAQRKRGARNAGIGSQAQVRGKNRLAELREKATAVEVPKAFEVCQCRYVGRGKDRCFIINVLWPEHSVFNQENLAFRQNPALVGSAGRRKKIRGND